MSSRARRHALVKLVQASAVDKRLLADRVRGLASPVRIWPGPAVMPAIVYARIRYEQTGRRQWVFAPGLTPWWWDAVVVRWLA